MPHQSEEIGGLIVDDLIVELDGTSRETGADCRILDSDRLLGSDSTGACLEGEGEAEA